MGSLARLKWSIDVGQQLVLGMYGFLGLPIEYFTQMDRNCDFSVSESLHLILLGTFSRP